MMKQEVIDKHIKLGNIPCYFAYGDDVFTCIVIDKQKTILNNKNDFDHLLKFTTLHMYNH